MSKIKQHDIYIVNSTESTNDIIIRDNYTLYRLLNEPEQEGEHYQYTQIFVNSTLSEVELKDMYPNSNIFHIPEQS